MHNLEIRSPSLANPNRSGKVPSRKSLFPTLRSPSFSSAFPSTATPGNMAEVSDIKLFGKWSYDDVDVSDHPLPLPRSRPRARPENFLGLSGALASRAHPEPHD